MARLRRPPDEVVRGDRSQPLRVVSSITLEAPATPKGLLAVTRRAWDAYWSSDLARLVEPDVDGPALERLFRLLDEAERARRTFVKEGRFTEGSTGQPVLSPAVKLWLDLQKQAKDLEDRFGFTPRARLNLGIKLGDAAASLAKLNEQWADDGGLEVLDIE